MRYSSPKFRFYARVQGDLNESLRHSIHLLVRMDGVQSAVLLQVHSEEGLLRSSRET